MERRLFIMKAWEPVTNLRPWVRIWFPDFLVSPQPIKLLFYGFHWHWCLTLITFFVCSLIYFMFLKQRCMQPRMAPNLESTDYLELLIVLPLSLISFRKKKNNNKIIVTFCYLFVCVCALMSVHVLLCVFVYTSTGKNICLQLSMQCLDIIWMTGMERYC